MLGRLLGAEIVARSSAAYWPERYFVRQLFARLEPDCVLDVGANGGQFGQDLRAAGFKGPILSFEPNPTAFERLRRAAARDGDWHVFPVALGRERGMARFNVMAADLFSSFRQPLTGPDVDFTDANRIERSIDVPVERLEDLLPGLAAEHGFSNPFLKMDTQGFDLEVFAGAGGEMRRFCALLSEVSLRGLYAASPDLHESIAAYRAGGFALASLFSVHPTMPLKAIEFNCYCVRDDLAEADRPA